MQASKEISTTAAALADSPGWGAHVAEVLKTWKGAAAGIAVAERRLEGIEDLASSVSGRAFVVSIRLNGDESGTVALAFGEDATRAAFALGADDPVSPVMEEFLGLLRERLASATGRAIELSIADEICIEVTRTSLEGIRSTMPTEPLRLLEATITLAESNDLVVHCVIHERGLKAEGADVSAAASPRAASRDGDAPDAGFGRLEIIMDVELPIVVRLGEAEMSLEEVLALRAGSIIELNKQVDEPAELIVNNKVVAYGEVVVVQEHFGLRITRLAHPAAEGIALLP